MMDKVNIIENLEELEWFLLREYEKAKDDIDTWYFRYHAVSDARELLKQEPVKPHYNARTNWYECGACHYSMTSGMHCHCEIIPSFEHNFCSKCGRPVDWSGYYADK